MAAAGPRPLTGTFRGAVLCGGASGRMGRDKATLEVAGTAMAVRVMDALRDAGADPVVAIGGDAAALEALGCTVIPDDEPGSGPLAATITTLRGSAEGEVVVLSCDLLGPNPEAITAMVDRLRSAAQEVLGVVPVVDGHHQWTHVAWRRTALEPLEAAQAAGARSLRRAGAGLPLVRLAELSASDVADADHPRDLPDAR